ncbi:MAG: FGGY-family carbohydrate kinase [Brevinema sp.]
MNKYLVGIDNGGTLVKTGIFDLKGNQISVASASIPTISLFPGYAERNLDAVWNANKQCIKQAIIDSGISPTDIIGISLSGHGKGLYMIGDKITNGIMSTDARAWEYIKKWYDTKINEEVFKKTYQDIMVMQPVTLLAWYKDHQPEIFHNCQWIFSAKDYIRYRLTDEIYAEYTDASGSNLINMNTKSYDIELLKLFGLESIINKLPPLKYSAEICGHITEKVSKDTGLPKGTPVAGGMFDIDACGIAVGLVNEKELCMIAGTWSINEYISKDPVHDRSVALNSLFCIPNYYLIEESSPTSAGNLEWFVQTFFKKELEDLKGKSIYPIINELVASVEGDKNDIIFLPFLNGSNDDVLAKGTFIGLTGYNNIAHVLTAVYEGIVFSHMMHVHKLLKNRSNPTSIRLAGGAARSEIWVQMFANALQIPIDIIADKELGCQGAAMVAGIAVGAYSSYEDAAQQTVHISNTIYPNPAKQDYYAQKYQVYLAVLEGLRPVWKHFEN